MSDNTNPSDKHLCCFPDTNFFIQCKSLNQLDWSLLGAFETIDLLVARPVQKEIDDFKGGGNARRSSKARVASTLFRDSIKSAEGYIEIRPNTPRVRLYVRVELRPDHKLKEDLDYTQPDDHLVGVVSSFLNLSQGGQTVLLTGDAGPMASAKMVNVPFSQTPDEWLLSPEDDKEKKELTQVKQELEKLKRAEPQILLKWMNSSQADGRYCENVWSYDPLRPSEIRHLMTYIRDMFPLVTKFNVENETGKGTTTLAPFHERDELMRKFNELMRQQSGEIYVEATLEQITQYREGYKKWIEKCERSLGNLHDLLPAHLPSPKLRFSLLNDGSRPAEKALISIKARGAFQIRPAKNGDDRSASTSKLLTPPPKAPSGFWKSMWAKESVGELYMPSVPERLLPAMRRDPEAFYYRSESMSAATEQVQLECECWRHQTDAEIFAVTLHPSALQVGDYSGAVEVNVQAANLSTPFADQIPVRLAVQKGDVLARAKEIVEGLRKK